MYLYCTYAKYYTFSLGLHNRQPFPLRFGSLSIGISSQNVRWYQSWRKLSTMYLVPVVFQNIGLYLAFFSSYQLRLKLRFKPWLYSLSSWLVLAHNYWQILFFFWKNENVWQFFWKNVKFLAIFWQLNGNFPESQLKIKRLELKKHLLFSAGGQHKVFDMCWLWDRPHRLALCPGQICLLHRCGQGQTRMTLTHVDSILLIL